MNKELLQQALELLVAYRDYTGDFRIANKCGSTIQALEAELAKPELPRVFREVPIGDNYVLRFYPSDTGWMCGISNEMMDAIEELSKPEQEPEPKSIKAEDLLVESYYPRTGTSDRGIKITHTPTGLIVYCESEYSQHANKKLALQKLEAKLAKPEQDWDLLAKTQESLREHMARIKELEAQLAKQKALDKKADNARDLGLDYEPEQTPVAWATFDGEGNYDYRNYEDNKNYRDEFIERNGTKYASWVMPLYAAPQKYCPSENNATYEKGFVDGMAKQMHSSVDRAVNAMDKKCDVHECRRKVREADDDASLAGAIIYRR
jgi:hypothetical protein